MRRDCTLVKLLKKILKISIVFVKAYNETFDATRIVVIVSDMMGSDLLIVLSAGWYYRYKRVAKMLLKDDSILFWSKASMETMSDVNSRTSPTWMMAGNTQRSHKCCQFYLELQKFLRNLCKSAFTYVLSYWTSAKTFPGKPKDVCVDHSTEPGL